ncbi:MAG: InlB B-repeat-containing protein [Clostridiales bacterium]|nr:InlB B-repeat-containing protein [Clostridiales bacterium]
MKNQAKRGIIFLLALFVVLGVTATVLVHAAGSDPGVGGATTYVISFNSNGGDWVSSQLVAAGATVTRPDNPVRAGYSFSGWFTDEVLSIEYDFDTVVNKNFTLYARWIAVSSSGGGTGGGGADGKTIAELFPSPQLASAVANYLRVNTYYIPSEKELTGIDYLWVPVFPKSGDFVSWKGLELLTGLEEFYLNNYNYYYDGGKWFIDFTEVDISSFPILPNLTRLNLSGMGITGDISVFAGLTGLQNLYLDSQDLRGNLNSLSELTDLSNLYIDSGSITGNLSDLAKMTGLNSLYIINAQVKGDVSSLPDFSQLFWFDLSNTKVSGNLSSLARFETLLNAYLAGTNISGNLSALSDLTNLHKLDLSGTQVSGNLNALTKLSLLEELKLANSKVSGKLSDLNGLLSYDNLYILDLSGTLITGALSDLSLKHPSTVRERIYGNGLAGLGLSRTAVTGDLSDLSFWIGLRWLELSETEIVGTLKDLPSPNALFSLNLSKAKITGDLKDLPDLHNLYQINLSNCLISGDLAGFVEKIGSKSNWIDLNFDGTGVYGDTGSIKTVRDILYSGGLSDLSITLNPITFTGSPITVDVPVKIDGKVIEIKSSDIVGNGSFGAGKMTWQVPASGSSGTLSYAFKGEDDVLGTYSGTIYQPYSTGSTGNPGGGSGSSQNYTVTFESNGGSDVTKQIVAAGGKAVKPVDPVKSGYIFAGWFTDKELSKEYNFDMAVGGSFTLYAKWAEAGSETKTWQNPFTDVKSGDWFYEHVQYVNSLGLMNGTSSTLFSPNVRLTRGMLVTILYRMDGEKAIDKPAGFDDVKEGMYYTDAVAWGEAKEIVKGYGDGTFKPEQTVSRQEMATVLLRYAKFIGKGAGSEVDTALGFVDAAKVGDWAKEGVSFCVKNGIMEGRPGNILDPAAFATRAEFATMLHRFAEFIK